MSPRDRLEHQVEAAKAAMTFHTEAGEEEM